MRPPDRKKTLGEKIAELGDVFHQVRELARAGYISKHETYCEMILQKSVEDHFQPLTPAETKIVKNVLGNDHSISARDVFDSIFNTGDNNKQSLAVNDSTFASHVNIRGEIEALKPLLLVLETPHANKLARAVEDVEDEVAKPEGEQDKGEIAGALERAVKYAKTADDLTAHAAGIGPRVAALASWLGERGKAIMDLWNG